MSAIEEVSTAFSAMKAHTDYWNSQDVMLFLISTMLRESVKDDKKYPPNRDCMTLVRPKEQYRKLFRFICCRHAFGVW